MRYMLDTNVLSDVLKNPQGKAAERIRSLAPKSVYTSTVVAGELCYGVEKKSSATLRTRVTQFLHHVPVLPLDAVCADTYGKIRAELEGKGLPIGANDLWIAAHALTLAMVLVTHNTKEFSRVRGLHVENWLES